jgi:hypothetical protein
MITVPTLTTARCSADAAAGHGLAAMEGISRVHTGDGGGLLRRYMAGGIAI